MKNTIFIFVALLTLLSSIPSFSQSKKDPSGLGLPGDNLDLYAVLDLFQKSKTIEDFEHSLNSEKEAVNNLDLNKDKKIDFIKVITKKEKDSFTFILQDPINKSETQDVAVILVSKEKNGKYSVQIIGDKELYGKDYIVEPITSDGTTVTPNPGYTGEKPITVTTAVLTEPSPVIVYLYSPVYVPYVPPYYYGFYPPYFHPWAPLYFAMYFHHHVHHHAHYHNTVVIHNSYHYNHYSHSYRHSSAKVSHYNKNGNYRNASQSKNYIKTTDAAVQARNTDKASRHQTSGISNRNEPMTRQANSMPSHSRPSNMSVNRRR